MVRMFGKIFHMENPFWRGMDLVARLVVLSLVTAVLCLPVVTAGAAVTALYTVTLKLVNRYEYPAMKGFFHGFRINFRQATLGWLIVLGIGLLLAFDLYVVTGAAVGIARALNYLFFMLMGFLILQTGFLFPLLSRFDNTLRGTLKNALILGVSNFMPWGLLMMVLNLLPAVIVWYRFSWLPGVVTVMIFGGIAATALINSLMLRRIFGRYAGSLEEPVQAG